MHTCTFTLLEYVSACIRRVYSCWCGYLSQKPQQATNLHTNTRTHKCTYIHTKTYIRTRTHANPHTSTQTRCVFRTHKYTVHAHTIPQTFPLTQKCAYTNLLNPKKQRLATYWTPRLTNWLRVWEAQHSERVTQALTHTPCCDGIWRSYKNTQEVEKVHNAVDFAFATSLRDRPAQRRRFILWYTWHPLHPHKHTSKPGGGKRRSNQRPLTPRRRFITLPPRLLESNSAVTIPILQSLHTRRSGRLIQSK